MRLRRITTAAAAATVLAGTALTAPPALAWGNSAYCAGHANVRQTNRWPHPFIGHNVDVALHVCWTAGNRTTVAHLLYTAKPRITYPGIPIISATESVKTSRAPFVNKVTKDHGQPVGVRYRWSVRQCVVNTPICNDIDFSVTYSLMQGSRICEVGGACDAWKRW